MKSAKKLLTVMLAALLLVTAALTTSCGGSGKYTIGISQLVTHDALDAATNGFKQAVIDALGEENVTFLYQNAAGDSAVCTTIANDFVSKNVDLIMANATAALQAAAATTTTIPILGTSITEYGVAMSIENFSGVVGGNISGTSDLAPLAEQAKMMTELFPAAKTIGMLYCSAEPNSAYQVKVVTEALTAAGITVKDFPFSDSNDIAAITEKAATDCDLIYIPTDNTAASCTETINNICQPKKVPIFAGEEGLCRGCGTFTLSISYYEIGYQTGEMAVKILRDKADISTMAIAYDPNPVKKYNKAICDALGIAAPDGYTAIG